MPDPPTPPPRGSPRGEPIREMSNAFDCDVTTPPRLFMAPTSGWAWRAWTPSGPSTRRADAVAERRGG